GAGGSATSSAVLGDLVAIARGLGSTWAGLPPATGPAIDADSPLDRARRWYVFIGATRDVEPPALLRSAGSVEFEDGTAIRTPVAALADVRAALREILPDDADPTLYPVDD
ncbi:MAG TPA: hypothetical protein VD763_06540, partial [Candidatus Saccharimonadales bacterium]|nr:hypothetical protein [Candidatus Saccharimonadales bacterium]